ncbi:NPHP3, partial [Symbiodinium sp. KB8]
FCLTSWSPAGVPPDCTSGASSSMTVCPGKGMHHHGGEPIPPRNNGTFLNNIASPRLRRCPLQMSFVLARRDDFISRFNDLRSCTFEMHLCLLRVITAFLTSSDAFVPDEARFCAGAVEDADGRLDAFGNASVLQVYGVVLKDLQQSIQEAQAEINKTSRDYEDMVSNASPPQVLEGLRVSRRAPILERASVRVTDAEGVATEGLQRLVVLASDVGRYGDDVHWLNRNCQLDVIPEIDAGMTCDPPSCLPTRSPARKTEVFRHRHHVGYYGGMNWVQVPAITATHSQLRAEPHEASRSLHDFLMRLPARRVLRGCPEAPDTSHASCSVSVPPHAASVGPNQSSLVKAARLSHQCMSCRLCLEAGGDANELLSPCACRGSSGYVHADCLAQWCSYQGNFRTCDVCHQPFVGKAALLLARHAYQRADRLGEEHPEALAATYHLAQALAGEGCHVEATKLFEYLQTVYNRRKGESHMDTLAVCSAWALSLCALGKHDDAATFQDSTLTKLRSKVGSGHPRSMTEANNLALTLTHLRRHDEALPLFREAFEYNERTTGSSSQEWITAANNLAGSLCQAGDLEEAAEVFLKAVGSGRRVLGERHPLSMKSASNLAAAWDGQPS